MKRLLSIILLSMLLVGCGSSTKKGTSISTPKPDKGYSSLVSVESVDIVSKKWGNGDTVDIVTTVKNNSDRVISYMEIQISYLDESGNVLNSVIKSCLTPIDPNAKQEILFPEKRENIIKISSKVIDVEFE